VEVGSFVFDVSGEKVTQGALKIVRLRGWS
jgi:hypothetical protein